MVNTSHRERAIQWLNSKKPDFFEGVSILEQTGFKPGVTRVLRRQGPDGPEVMSRLRYNLLEYARATATAPTPTDTDPDLHVFDGKESPTVTEDSADDKHSIIRAILLSESGSATYTGTVRELLKRYSECYTTRSKAELALADLPEENDEETIEKRKQLLASIDECTDELERLYPLWTKYTTEGVAPTDEELEGDEEDTPLDDDDADTTSASGIDYDSMPLEELKKLRKNTTTKISRAQNMLLYSTESKQEVENPLTDPYKITKCKARIERDSQELDRIKMAIARKG